MRGLRATLTILMLLIATPLLAKDAPKLDPGKWEIHWKRSNSFGQNNSVTESRCFTADQLSKGALEAIFGDSNKCNMLEQRFEQSVLKFKMSCPFGHSNGTANGTFSAKGSTAEGQMSMTFPFQGREATIEQSWKAKRISAQCD